MNDGLLILAAQGRRARIVLLEAHRVLVELACICRAKQRRIEHCDLGYPANDAMERKALPLPEFALPAAFGLLGKRVEAPRDVSRRIDGCARIAENALREHSGNRCLLDDFAVIAAMQAIEHVAYAAGLLNQ